MLSILLQSGIKSFIIIKSTICSFFTTSLCTGISKLCLEIDAVVNGRAQFRERSHDWSTISIHLNDLQLTLCVLSKLKAPRRP